MRGVLAPLRNLKLYIVCSARSLGFCVRIGSAPCLCLQEIWDTLRLTSRKARLKSVTPEHRDVRQILINVPFGFPPENSSVNIRRVIRETTYGQRLDLDCLLVRFWESHLIRPKIRHSGVSRRGKKDTIDCVLRSSPEMTKGELIDLVDP